MSSKRFIDHSITLIIAIFIIVWVVLLGLDYLNKHPAYYYAFKYFRYGGLVVGIIILSAAVAALYKFSSIFRRYLANGLGLIIAGLITCFMVIHSHSDLVPYASEFNDRAHFTIDTLSVALQIILLLVVCHINGTFIYKKLLADYCTPTEVLNTGLGMMVLTTLMFFFGALGYFNITALGISLAAMLLTGYKYIKRSAYVVFIKPVQVGRLNLFGYAAGVVVFTFLLINFTSIQTPFPSGFDSRNYYINISKLVAGNESLISGFPPYNGSLIIAFGFLVNQAELSLGLSFAGIVLALLVAFRFSRDKLHFDENMSLFILAVVTVTPALVNQMFVELKVDFLLLFFQFLTLYYLFDTFKVLEKIDLKGRPVRQVIRIVLPYTALLGILLGFGMGIKMINLFLVTTVLILIWWDNKNRYATMGALCLGIVLFLVAGIDRMSGLRKYHEDVHVSILLLGFFGLLFLIVSFIVKQQNSLRKLIFSVMVGLFTFLAIAPWLVKNYTDTGTFDPRIMLMGDEPGPDINAAKIKRTYEKTKTD